MGSFKFSYTPQGVCCRRMDIEIEDGRLVDVVFHGGCNGNLQGIAALVRGMNVEEVVNRLSGIDCGGRGASCPDQLAKALK